MAISLAGDADLDSDRRRASSVRQPRLAPLADLHTISRSHASRVAQAQRLILVPNLICVAGRVPFDFHRPQPVNARHTSAPSAFIRIASRFRSASSIHPVGVDRANLAGLVRPESFMATTSQITDFQELARLIVAAANSQVSSEVQAFPPADSTWR